MAIWVIGLILLHLVLLRLSVLGADMLAVLLLLAQNDFVQKQRDKRARVPCRDPEHETARRDKTGQGKAGTSHGTAPQDRARRGKARRDKAL